MQIIVPYCDESGMILCRVRWFGFGADDDSYESYENIRQHFVARSWKKGKMLQDPTFDNNGAENDKLKEVRNRYQASKW